MSPCLQSLKPLTLAQAGLVARPVSHCVAPGSQPHPCHGHAAGLHAAAAALVSGHAAAAVRQYNRSHPVPVRHPCRGVEALILPCEGKHDCWPDQAQGTDWRKGPQCIHTRAEAPLSCRGSAPASSQTAASRSSRSSRSGGAPLAKVDSRQQRATAVAAKAYEPLAVRQQHSGAGVTEWIPGPGRENDVAYNVPSNRSPRSSVRPASGSSAGRRSAARSSGTGALRLSLMVAPIWRVPPHPSCIRAMLCHPSSSSARHSPHHAVHLPSDSQGRPSLTPRGRCGVRERSCPTGRRDADHPALRPAAQRVPWCGRAQTELCSHAA